jgi:hypothetical protein
MPLRLDEFYAILLQGAVALATKKVLIQLLLEYIDFEN